MPLSGSACFLALFSFMIPLLPLFVVKTQSPPFCTNLRSVVERLAEAAAANLHATANSYTQIDNHQTAS